jgi:hypothetical protein
MSAYTLTRTGDAPLKFSGELLAEAGGRHFRGREQNRWHELSIYATDAGAYVVAIAFRTRWQGEAEHDEAHAVATLPAVAQVLRDYNPVRPRVGYPPGPEYAERQARLGAALQEQYAACVSEVLSDERFAESPEAALRTGQDMERYRWLLDQALAGLQFSRGEACLICDALNGTWLLNDTWRWWPAEVEDAIRLNGLDDKWEVDAKALLSKVNGLTPTELCAVADAAERFWETPEAEGYGKLREVGLLR